MWREDIDEHDVERRRFKCADTRFAAVGDRDFESLALKTGLNRRANHGVVINNQDPRHDMIPRSKIVLTKLQV